MFAHYVGLLYKDPLMIPLRIWDRAILFWLSRKKNIRRMGSLNIYGRPLVDIHEDCELVIGDNVTINSRNKGYHVNMHSPVKLFADRDGAKICIGKNTRIHGSCLHAYSLIEIGENCLIAANCQIIDGNGHDVSFPDVENRINTTGPSKPVKIEDNVWIGANTIILPGVTIGYGSVVSANSVVVDDIPDMVIASGNPARVIKDYKVKNR